MLHGGLSDVEQQEIVDNFKLETSDVALQAAFHDEPHAPAASCFCSTQKLPRKCGAAVGRTRIRRELRPGPAARAGAVAVSSYPVLPPCIPVRHVAEGSGVGVAGRACLRFPEE